MSKADTPSSDDESSFQDCQEVMYSGQTLSLMFTCRAESDKIEKQKPELSYAAPRLCIKQGCIKFPVI